MPLALVSIVIKMVPELSRHNLGHKSVVNSTISCAGVLVRANSSLSALSCFLSPQTCLDSRLHLRRHFGQPPADDRTRRFDPWVASLYVAAAASGQQVVLLPGSQPECLSHLLIDPSVLIRFVYARYCRRVED